MRYDLLFYHEWYYLVGAVVLLFVITLLIAMFFANRKRWGLECIGVVFCLCVLGIMFYRASDGFVKLHRLKNGYVIELQNSIFPDTETGETKCLVSSFKVYPSGLVSFDYTIPAKPVGSEYIYFAPAEIPEKNIKYKGSYNRIYSIADGRFLRGSDFEKFVSAENSESISDNAEEKVCR
jgi:hypothetical protein